MTGTAAQAPGAPHLTLASTPVLRRYARRALRREGNPPHCQIAPGPTPLSPRPGADAPADSPTLESLGFSDRWRALFAAHAEAGHVPARVVRSGRGSAVVAAAHGIVRAKPSARLRRRRDSATGHARPDGRLRADGRASAGSDGPPACGDWVVLDPAPTHEAAVIEAILPLRLRLHARSLGRTAPTPQVIAANMDTVFVVHPVEPTSRTCAASSVRWRWRGRAAPYRSWSSRRRTWRRLP